ncbi:hypothetical protein 33D_0045 [Mycobacterium phage 33D]|nr:hypothetical protein 33D_0045 [Mycobacterium phage 33D]
MTYRYVENRVLRFVQLALLVDAVVRGASWIATPASGIPPAIGLAAEGTAAMWVWGAVFAVFGILGLLGELWMHLGESEHRAWPLFLAHAALLFLFAGLALSAVNNVITTHATDGFSAPYTFALLALLHWVFARRRKHVG